MSTNLCNRLVRWPRLPLGNRRLEKFTSAEINFQMIIAKYSARCLLLAFAAVSMTLSACTNTSSSAKPSYNNTQTSSTTTTGNEPNPPPPATRSAQHSGTPQ